jgi:hypothetical protein
VFFLSAPCFGFKLFHSSKAWTSTPPRYYVDPQDGAPVSQPTTAYLSYDDRNLYVAFVCKDDPALIRANIAKRKDILTDDRVAINIDTFHDHKRAMYRPGPYRLCERPRSPRRTWRQGDSAGLGDARRYSESGFQPGGKRWAQVSVNQRYEAFHPEKRPFFSENKGFFDTPEQLFFSRRIIDPQFGARRTGKIGRWAIGALVTTIAGPGNWCRPGTRSTTSGPPAACSGRRASSADSRHRRAHHRPRVRAEL